MTEILPIRCKILFNKSINISFLRKKLHLTIFFWPAGGGVGGPATRELCTCRDITALGEELQILTYHRMSLPKSSESSLE